MFNVIVVTKPCPNRTPYIHLLLPEFQTEKVDQAPLTCGNKVDHARLLLNADLVGGPAEQRPVVLFHRGRVIEDGRRALALDGLKGKRLALRRSIKPPREVNLMGRDYIKLQYQSTECPSVMWR